MNNYKKNLIVFKNYLQKLNFRSQIKKIRSSKIIWHFCTPKCASTFYAKYMQQTLKYNNLHTKSFQISSMPEFGERYQVVDKNLLSKLLVKDKNFIHLVYRSHTIASKDLLDIISNQNHNVIIQYRPINETLISLCNFLNKSPETIWSSVLKIKWKSFNNDEKIEKLIDFYLPWHVQFLQSWINQNKFRSTFLKMEDVIKDPYEAMRLSFNNYNIEFKKIETNFSNDEIMYNKNHNEAEIILSDYHKQKIRDFVIRNDFLGQNLVEFI
tara:strand:+ start:1475 stop:2278 length:804 start_codon:yes stop_codon:yes gene_type:complete